MRTQDEFLAIFDAKRKRVNARDVIPILGGDLTNREIGELVTDTFLQPQYQPGKFRVAKVIPSYTMAVLCELELTDEEEDIISCDHYWEAEEGDKDAETAIVVFDYESDWEMAKRAARGE